MLNFQNKICFASLTYEYTGYKAKVIRV